MSNPRIAGRRGQIVNLDASFYHNGVLADPFGIRRIEIYHTQILPHNLYATILLPHPEAATYPAPLTRTGVGQFVLPYVVPREAPVPDVFFDVWYFYPVNPCNDEGTNVTAGTGTAGCDLDAPDIMQELISNCHRFWLYPDGWASFDTLQTLDLGFEPLAQRFNTPEKRPLEVGMMPLPLYDFNVNLVMPILPMLQATITVETRYREVLVKDEPMTIKLRQGSFRTNPFVLSWVCDTTRFLIGTYQYRVTVTLPDGSTRVSPSFNLVVN